MSILQCINLEFEEVVSQWKQNMFFFWVTLAPVQVQIFVAGILLATLLFSILKFANLDVHLNHMKKINIIALYRNVMVKLKHTP